MKLCLQCGASFSSQDWQCPLCLFQPKVVNRISLHAPDQAYSGNGFQPEYFSQLVDLENKNFWFKSRNQLLLWALKKFKNNTRLFLEVGCGTGFVLSGIARSFPDIQLYGSEIFIEGLKLAQKRLPSSHLMQLDARQLPFQEEFDAIGAFDVLEHIEEDETVLVQMYQALKGDGVLMLTVPQHPRLWSASDTAACHKRRYTRHDLEQKIKNAGFKILKSSSFMTALLPVMLASRWLQAKKTGQYELLKELQIHPLLNSIFYAILMLEVKAIQLGFNFQFGGSRLLVALKPTSPTTD